MNLFSCPSLKQTECVICLEDFKSDEMITQLTCQHAFHQKCVQPWIVDYKSCPLCRKKAVWLSLPSPSVYLKKGCLLGLKILGIFSIFLQVYHRLLSISHEDDLYILEQISNNTYKFTPRPPSSFKATAQTYLLLATLVMFCSMSVFIYVNRHPLINYFSYQPKSFKYRTIN